MSNPVAKMPLFRLAIRNARRNTRRSLLTAIAILVAVMSVTFTFGYIGGAINDMMSTYARTQSGHVRITHREYPDRERFLPLHLNVPHVSELLPIIRTHPAVKGAVARIRTAVLIDFRNENSPGLLIGAEFEKERGYFDILDMVVEGRAPQPGSAEILIGAILAEQLEVTTGDTLILLGQTAYRSMGGIRAEVTGLARSGLDPIDRNVLFMPLDQVQLMTDLYDGTTEILVFAEDVEQVEILAGSLRSELDGLVTGGLEIQTWKDQGPLVQMMESAGSIFGVVIFILMLMAGLIIINTMLMTILERTQEFGMLSALGMRRSRIVALILNEGLVIGIVGALLGGIVGSGLSIWMESHGFNISAAMEGMDFPMKNVIYTDWKLIHPIIGIFVGIATAMGATLIPARRIAGLKPAEALRDK